MALAKDASDPKFEAQVRAGLITPAAPKSEAKPADRSMGEPSREAAKKA